MKKRNINKIFKITKVHTHDSKCNLTRSTLKIWTGPRIFYCQPLLFFFKNSIISFSLNSQHLH